jgi:hypothetical protein
MSKPSQVPDTGPNGSHADVTKIVALVAAMRPEDRALLVAMAERLAKT